MKKLLTVFTLFSIGCSAPPVEEKAADKKTVTEPEIVSRPLTDSLSLPSKQFIQLAKQIDTAGYLYDTARIKKVVHYFRTDAIVKPDNYIFYKMQLNDSYVIEYREFAKKTGGHAKDGMINYDYFKDAISVFGYYYNQKERSGLMVDGFIEEWLFASAEEAEKAVKDVDRVKEVVYFNTESFCCQVDTRMYIFHVRASGFSPQLEKFFKRFVKDNNAFVPKR